MSELSRVNEYLRQSRVAEAEALLATLLAASPGDPVLHRARAVAAQLGGRIDDAIDAMRAAAALAPEAFPLQMELGQMLAAHGHAGDAAVAFERATALRPASVDAWYLLGGSLYQARRDADALAAFAHADALAPGQPLILRARAEAEYALEHHADALALLERIAGDWPDTVDPMLFLRRAQCLRRTGLPGQALAVAREGLERFANDAPLWQELGWIQEDLGDAAQAREAYTRAHDLRPGWGDPLGSLLALLRDHAPPPVVEAARQLLDDERVPAQERAYLHHMLGKRDDARGDYGDAARHWSAANALRRTIDGAFDRDVYAATIDAAIAAFPRELLAARAPDALRDRRPVFVVGMPRSGTTLAEQILAAHPDVHGGGELTGIVAIAQDLPTEGVPTQGVPVQAATTRAGPAQAGLRWPQDAARVDPAWLRQRAQAYLSAAASTAHEGATRLVDKQPYNFLHVGLLAMLFADARILWCRRDPRDVALSIYSESFSPMSGYATDLDDIAFFIEGQERLMRHWQAVSPLPILEVHYEDVVADTEAQARRLIDFAGLRWDARCLDFHASGRSVQTLSRWQVRQPVHGRSVGRWRHYAQWFQAPA